MVERFKWKCGHVWWQNWTKRTVEMLNEGYPYIETFGCPYCGCMELISIEEVVTTKYKTITTKDILGLNIVMKDGTDYAYRG